MKHIAQVLDTTLASWQAPRPLKDLTSTHAFWLQRQIVGIPACVYPTGGEAPRLERKAQKGAPLAGKVALEAQAGGLFP